MITAITEKAKQETPVNALLALAACIFFMAAHLILTSRFLSASKIEEGTVVAKNDSITTIIIPDIR